MDTIRLAFLTFLQSCSFQTFLDAVIFPFAPKVFPSNILSIFIVVVWLSRTFLHLRSAPIFVQLYIFCIDLHRFLIHCLDLNQTVLYEVEFNHDETDHVLHTTQRTHLSALAHSLWYHCNRSLHESARTQRLPRTWSVSSWLNSTSYCTMNVVSITQQPKVTHLHSAEEASAFRCPCEADMLKMDWRKI